VSRYVLDSYAILAFVRQEPAGHDVARLLEDPSHHRWMSIINVGEVYYRTYREHSVRFANSTLRWLRRQSITFVEADLRRTLVAASIKGRYTLSYADCFAAALAREVTGAVVTADREFVKLQNAGLVEVRWLQGRPR
jgi:ribonuclease VapC